MPKAANRDVPRDDVVDALEKLIDALHENARANTMAVKRAQAMIRERAKGRTYREIVTAAQRPLIVELATQNLNRLLTAGSRLRRAEAKALHDEGLTMEQIAQLFGVSRQRVSALLKAQSKA